MAASKAFDMAVDRPIVIGLNGEYQMSENAPIDQDTYNERQTLLARSAIIALTADGRSFDFNVRDQALGALSVSRDEYTREMWELDKEGRIEYGVGGLKTTCGTFPETEFENRIRTELVQPIAEHVDQVQAIRLYAGHVLSEQALQEVAAQDYLDAPSPVKY